MAEVKIVLGTKTGKSYQTTTDISTFTNKKIGEKVNNIPNFSGYEFEITGGSDNAGFPMRKDIEGPARKKPLLTSGPGVYIKRHGMKKRKTVRGNTIADDIAQINLKVLTPGKKPLEDILGKKEETKEVPKEEPKKEQPKEQKAEAKPEVKKQPKEEKK